MDMKAETDNCLATLAQQFPELASALREVQAQVLDWPEDELLNQHRGMDSTAQALRLKSILGTLRLVKVAPPKNEPMERMFRHALTNERFIQLVPKSLQPILCNGSTKGQLAQPSADLTRGAIPAFVGALVQYEQAEEARAPQLGQQTTCSKSSARLEGLRPPKTQTGTGRLRTQTGTHQWPGCKWQDCNSKPVKCVEQGDQFGLFLCQQHWEEVGVKPIWHAAHPSSAHARESSGLRQQQGMPGLAKDHAGHGQGRGTAQFPGRSQTQAGSGSSHQMGSVPIKKLNRALVHTAAADGDVDASDLGLGPAGQDFLLIGSMDSKLAFKPSSIARTTAQSPQQQMEKRSAREATKWRNQQARQQAAPIAQGAGRGQGQGAPRRTASQDAGRLGQAALSKQAAVPETIDLQDDSDEDKAGPGPSSIAAQQLQADAGLRRIARGNRGVSLATRFAGLKAQFPALDKDHPHKNRSAVQLSAEDLARLEPSEFLNDSVIDFYIQKLEHELKEKNPELHSRCYFFNTFFFKKLTEKEQRGGGPKGNKDRLNHERVKKWTKHVDIFSKDFLFIPVHDVLHWSLVVVCHPGNVFSGQDQAYREAQGPAADAVVIEEDHHGADGGIQASLVPEPTQEVTQGNTQCEGQASLGSVPAPETVDLQDSEDANDEEGAAAEKAAPAVDVVGHAGQDAPVAEAGIESKGVHASRHSEAGDSSDEKEAEEQAAQQQAAGGSTSPAPEASHGDGATTPAAADAGRKAGAEQAAADSAASAARAQEEALRRAGRRCLLHFDSMSGSHEPRTIYSTVRAYLQHEWWRKAKDPGPGPNCARDVMHEHSELTQQILDEEFDAVHLPGYALRELPTQNNHCDCGLFLLAYMEFFVAADPLRVTLVQPANSKAGTGGNKRANEPVHVEVRNPGSNSCHDPATFMRKAWFKRENVARLRDHLRFEILRLLLHQAPDSSEQRTQLEAEVDKLVRETEEHGKGNPVGMIYLTPDAYHSWYKCHPKAPVNPQAPSGTLDDDDDNYMLPSHAYVPSHGHGTRRALATASCAAATTPAAAVPAAAGTTGSIPIDAESPGVPVSGSRIRKRKVSSVAPPSAPGSNAPMQQQPAEGVDVLEDDMGEGDGSAQPAQATRTKDPSTQTAGVLVGPIKPGAGMEEAGAQLRAKRFEPRRRAPAAEGSEIVTLDASPGDSSDHDVEEMDTQADTSAPAAGTGMAHRVMPSAPYLASIRPLGLPGPDDKRQLDALISPSPASQLGASGLIHQRLEDAPGSASMAPGSAQGAEADTSIDDEGPGGEHHTGSAGRHEPQQQASGASTASDSSGPQESSQALAQMPSSVLHVANQDPAYSAMARPPPADTVSLFSKLQPRAPVTLPASAAGQAGPSSKKGALPLQPTGHGSHLHGGHGALCAAVYQHDQSPASRQLVGLTEDISSGSETDDSGVECMEADYPDVSLGKLPLAGAAVSRHAHVPDVDCLEESRTGKQPRKQQSRSRKSTPAKRTHTKEGIKTQVAKKRQKQAGSPAEHAQSRISQYMQPQQQPGVNTSSGSKVAHHAGPAALVAGADALAHGQHQAGAEDEVQLLGSGADTHKQAASSVKQLSSPPRNTRSAAAALKAPASAGAVLGSSTGGRQAGGLLLAPGAAGAQAACAVHSAAKVPLAKETPWDLTGDGDGDDDGNRHGGQRQKTEAASSPAQVQQDSRQGHDAHPSSTDVRTLFNGAQFAQQGKAMGPAAGRDPSITKSGSDNSGPASASRHSLPGAQQGSMQTACMHGAIMHAPNASTRVSADEDAPRQALMHLDANLKSSSDCTAAQAPAPTTTFAATIAEALHESNLGSVTRSHSKPTLVGASLAAACNACQPAVQMPIIQHLASPSSGLGGSGSSNAAYHMMGPSGTAPGGQPPACTIRTAGTRQAVSAGAADTVAPSSAGNASAAQHGSSSRSVSPTSSGRCASPNSKRRKSSHPLRNMTRGHLQRVLQKEQAESRKA